MNARPYLEAEDYEPPEPLASDDEATVIDGLSRQLHEVREQAAQWNAKYHTEAKYASALCIAIRKLNYQPDELLARFGLIGRIAESHLEPTPARIPATVPDFYENETFNPNR